MMRGLLADGLRWVRHSVGRLFGSKLVSAATLGVLVTIAGVVFVTVWNIRDHSIVIEPMSVPEALMDDGYLPTVASQKLQDAISDIVVRARSSRKHESVKLSAELPDFVVPAIGLSASTMARAVLSTFHLRTQRTISGEFTFRKDRLRLTVRMNGEVVFPDRAGTGPGEPDALIAAAARAVLRRTQPFFLAAAETDPRIALREVDLIIGRLPRDDENVREAYNLRGTIFIKMKERGLAADAYRRCIKLYPDFAVPHYNLGNVLLDLGRVGDAIAEYGLAIDLDRRYHKPYNGLGDAFAAQNKTGEAIVAYLKAIEMQPSDPEIHDSLGELLHRVGQLDGAAAELSIASKLDPSDSDVAYFNDTLGQVLKEQGHADDAISAFRNALAAKPADSDASYYLARTLTDAATASTSRRMARINLEDACEALDGISDPARMHDARALRREIDAKLWRIKARCVVKSTKRPPRKRR
jgi:tetratricopeptide (TPR) repeat protein